MKKLWTLIAGCLLLSACGIGDTNTTYERSQIGRQGRTSTGKIIAMTQVDVAGTSGTGTLTGAVLGGALGGVAGHSMGGGSGKQLLTIAGAGLGALAGGAAGAGAEQALTKDTAYEFLVQKGNSDTVVSVVQTNELGLKPGDRVILVEIDGTTRIRQRY